MRIFKIFILLGMMQTSFAQEGLFEGITFSIPENVVSLPQNTRNLYFGQTGQVPDLAYQDLDTKANITFMKTAIPLTRDKFSELQSTLAKQFSNPSITIHKQEIKHIAGKDFVFFKVSIPTEKGNVTVENLNTDIKGKLVTINISYLSTFTDWSLKSEQFISSIKVN